MTFIAPGSVTAANGTWLPPGVGTGTQTSYSFQRQPPYTIHPALLSGGFVFAANQGWWAKSLGMGLVSKIGMYVLTQAGNVCVGIYSSAGGINPPNALIAVSPVVPCPAAGPALINLNTQVMVDESCYFAFSTDGAPSLFASSAAGVSAGIMGVGISYFGGGVHPLTPIAPVGTFQTMRSSVIMLWGVP